jgi:hypothetical protein
MMRNALPAYESYAKKQQYYFTEGNIENCTRLGGFDNYHFE